MRRIAFMCLTTALAPAACQDPAGEDDGAGPATGGPDDQPVWVGAGPYRDGWSTELELDVDFTDGDGLPLITRIVVGGLEVDDNFRNQGDVIVKFDGDEGRIRVDLRRFTFADDPESAAEDFDRVHLWAYASGSPKQPAKMSIDTSCHQIWREGCHVRIWYDGQAQPIRTGADIRVTLPPSYRQHIEVITGDVVGEDTYLLRGDVCLEDLPGSADVVLDDGVSLTRLARDVTPGPSCSADQIAVCEADGWPPTCPCSAYGRFTVEGQTATAMVDMAETLWSAIVLENAATDPTPCDLAIGIPGVDVDPATVDDPGRMRGFLNHPGPDAIAGGGYSIQLTSGGCAPVFYSPYPAAWPGEGHKDEQRLETRGDLEVCSDCLATMDCDALLTEL